MPENGAAMEKRMALVMLNISYAPQAMEWFMTHPEDRQSQVESLFQSAQCRLIGAWYVNGSNRAIFVVEGEPENTRAVGIVALASKSVISCETSDLTAFSDARAYFARAQSIQNDYESRQTGSVPSFLASNG